MPTEIPDLLNCLGHYGYGSGWKRVPYCQDICPKGYTCLQITCGGEPLIPATEVEQNRLDGQRDRIEGVPTLKYNRTVDTRTTLPTQKPDGHYNL
jgi:hypothetical protein